MKTAYVITSDEYHDNETLYAVYLDEAEANRVSKEVWPGSMVQAVPLAPETKPARIFYEIGGYIRDYYEYKAGDYWTSSRTYDDGSEPNEAVYQSLDSHIICSALTREEADQIFRDELVRRGIKLGKNTASY